MRHPSVLVIGGNPGRWSGRDRAHHAAFSTGIESWAYATEGAYIDHASVSLHEVNKHDVIICNTNRADNVVAVEKYARLAESRRSSVLWVSLLEGDMRLYMRPNRTIRRVLDASTLINCINNNATYAIQQTTSAPVVYIGIPYPVASVASVATPIAERKRRVFLCGFLPQRWNDIAVASKLNIPMDGFHVRMHRKVRNICSNWRQFGTLLDRSAPLRKAESEFNIEHLHVHTETSTRDYLAAMGANMLWINLDERYTWGRYVLDAAALGVPLVTTRSTGHGQLLFPRTTVETAFSLPDAIQHASSLLEDANYYADVVGFAQNQVWQYDSPAIVQSLYDHLSI